MPPRPHRRRAATSTPDLARRAAMAVGAGLALVLAFPTHDLWWLAPVGVAGLAAATWGTRWTVASGLGLLAGLAFFLPTLSWSGIYVGALPWVALATLQALYVAAMTAALAAVQRPFLDTRLQPLAHAAVPLLWVLQETARSHTPFGGFPWARLAFSQADSALAHLAAYAGAPGVTFAVAAVGAVLHAACRVLLSRSVLSRSVLSRDRRPSPPARVSPLGAVLLVAALLPVVLAVVARPPADGRPVDVLLVQGNVPRPGLDFNAERRAVLDNHVEQTVRGVQGREGPPTLVVWPENSSDIDPLRNPDAAAAIERAVEAAQAPVLVGAVLREPDPYLSNASLFYRPEGGQPQRYVKQHPVPFAEYIPFRGFFRLLSDKVDLVAADFTAGEGPASFEVPVPGAAPYAVVPTICFEVAYDDLMREATLAPGAEESLLVVQTNNATFGYTAESEQQFAISRIRAIEHGRSVVHVSTVGVSGFIAPDGTAPQRTELFTAAAVPGTPVTRSEVTVSDRIGDAPEYAAATLLLLLVVAGRWQATRAARVEPHPRTEEEPAVV